MSIKRVHKVEFKSNDFDEFSTMIKNANLEILLLEKGLFRGKGTLLKGKHVLVSSFVMNKKNLQMGTAVPGFITFVICKPDISVKWRNYELEHGMIGVLWKNEHHAIADSNLIGMPISIDENYFEECCRLIGCPEVMTTLRKNDLLKVNQTHLKELRIFLDKILNSESLVENISLKVLEHQLVELLINTISFSIPEKTFYRENVNTFNNAVDYIHDNIKDLTTVNEVCRSLNVSDRQLRHLFQKKYAISPKNYIQNLKLSLIYKRLKVEQTEEVTIRSLAGDFNFWHMGQFSRDYRKLFGELPSETLTKSRAY